MLEASLPTPKSKSKKRDDSDQNSVDSYESIDDDKRAKRLKRESKSSSSADSRKSSDKSNASRRKKRSDVRLSETEEDERDSPSPKNSEAMNQKRGRDDDRHSGSKTERVKGILKKQRDQHDVNVDDRMKIKSKKADYTDEYPHSDSNHATENHDVDMLYTQFQKRLVMGGTVFLAMISFVLAIYPFETYRSGYSKSDVCLFRDSACIVDISASAVFFVSGLINIATLIANREKWWITTRHPSPFTWINIVILVKSIGISASFFGGATELMDVLLGGAFFALAMILPIVARTNKSVAIAIFLSILYGGFIFAVIINDAVEFTKNHYGDGIEMGFILTMGLFVPGAAMTLPLTVRAFECVMIDGRNHHKDIDDHSTQMTIKKMKGDEHDTLEADHVHKRLKMFKSPAVLEIIYMGCQLALMTSIYSQLVVFWIDANVLI